MRKLLIHLRNAEAEQLDTALSYAKNYAKACKGEDCRIIMLVNGPAVQFFTCNSEFNPQVAEALVAAPLKVKLCSHALANAGIDEDQLVSECLIVPLGIVELVEAQDKGYAYVRV